ncbi:MAG: hypothetical protein U9N83_02605 [Thermodesulfobacteriota bacterium]|nr:hypothetical protein [Thermodesulfobacteriota bacterium]
MSSHKSTDTISGDCLFITVIDIQKIGTAKISFAHRMEVVWQYMNGVNSCIV